jgi:hypothetical protein
MRYEEATILVTCRFPTGPGNRVRVVIDEVTAGELDQPIGVRSGKHKVRVTSWGLPLCGPLPVRCAAGDEVELALRVCFSGFAVGMALFVLALAGLSLGAVALGQLLPGYEALVVPAVGVGLVTALLLDFYVLLPAFSVYTFWLDQTGE